MTKKITILLFSMICYGCADSARIVQDARYDTIKLSSNASAYVSVPKDGRYGTKIYSGSGHSVTVITGSVLLQHLVEVHGGKEYEDYNDALSSAKKYEADYLFFQEILHWEDRATEWSAKPDKVQVKITVVDVKAEKRVSATTIDGSSGLATFGGDHPQDLLPEPVTKYVGALFKQ